MITIQYVEFENFLSVGSKKKRFDFINGEVHLIVGQNGSGKTLLLDALFYAIYGKSLRGLNVGQMVNSVNGKNCLVEVGIQSGGHTYRIIRGMKPKVFDVYKDGEPINLHGESKHVQKFIEESVIRMNEHTFKQVVLLGSMTYTPFLQLTGPDRRKVVDDIFGFGILKTYLDAAKVLKKETVTELTKVEHSVSQLKEWILSDDKLLKTLENQAKSESDEIRSQIESNEKLLDEYREQAKALRERIQRGEKMENELREYVDAENQRLADIRRLKAEYEKLKKGGKCPTCGTVLSDNTNELNAIRGKIEKLEHSDSNVEYIEKHEKVVSLLSKLRNELGELKGKASTIKIENARLTEKLSKGDNSKAISDVRDRLREKEKRLQDENVRLNELQRLDDGYSKAIEVLGDSGLKKSILAKYVPVFTKFVSSYLDKLGFKIKIQFDEKFNDTITRSGIEYGYANFSAGEKMRIDLAVIFAWRDLAKLQSGTSCNLVIFDEIGDSSLDDEGIESFVDIVGNGRDEQACIIISHNPDNVSEAVDKVFLASKTGVFTQYEELKN